MHFYFTHIPPYFYIQDMDYHPNTRSNRLQRSAVSLERSSGASTQVENNHRSSLMDLL